MAYVLNPLHLVFPNFRYIEGPIDTLGNKFDFRCRRQTVPASLVPRKVRIIDNCGFDYMFNIFHLCSESIYISDRCRKILEEYAPGQVEYIPVEFEIPRALSPAKAYFFINALALDQAMDYEATPCRTLFESGQPEIYSDILRPEDERPVVAPKNTIWHGDWVMKKRGINDPSVWLEDDVVTSRTVYRCSEGVFFKDSLWQTLDAAFPDELPEKHYAYVQER